MGFHKGYTSFLYGKTVKEIPLPLTSAGTALEDVPSPGNHVYTVTAYAYGTNYAWGTQSLNINPGNTGQRVLLSRLDAATGNCLSLSVIPSTSSSNTGSAIAVDSNGDYIVGGAMGGTSTFDSGTITNIGGQSDFFVAKYATAPCVPLGIGEIEKPSLKAWPNPVHDFLQLNNADNADFVLYSVLGKQITKGTLAPNGQIDMKGLAPGVYFLRIAHGNGTERLKVVKQ